MINRTGAGFILKVSLLLLLVNASQAQDSKALPNLNPKGAEVLLYKLNREQALFLTGHTISFSDTAFFSNFVKVTHNDDDINRLPFGHYLQVSANGPSLNYQYIPVSPFILYMADNSTDLLIQIRDKKNNKTLGDLKVLIGGHYMPFDKATDAYRIPRANLSGFMDIALNDEHYYYQINKSSNTKPSKKFHRSLFRFRAARIMVNTPVFIARIPVDGYKSIVKGHAQGSIYRIKNNTIQRWNKLAKTWNKIFKKSAADWDSDDDYDELYDEYTFFSKPKYRLNDTVSFKMLLMEKKSKKWMKVPLMARLRNGNEIFNLGICTPQNASGYYYTFYLHDSLKIKPDRDYSIELIDSDSIEYQSCSFHVEEYELQKSVFNIDCSNREQIKGKPFEIKYTAKDENGLPMRDAKAEVRVVAISINNILPDRLFVPTNIWKHEFAIEDGSKTFIVPDSIFADANYNYLVQTTLRNAENEKRETSFNIGYVQKKFEIKEALSGDSIEVKAYQNDSVVKYKANIIASDRYGYVLSDDEVLLPYKTKINTHVSNYLVKSEKLNYNISMSDHSAQVEVNASRDADKVFVSVVNALNLPFTYQVYQRNKEVMRGNGNGLDTAIAANEKDLYYVAVQYIWAGRMQSNMYQIPLHDKLVNLTVDQPQIIYPGKETDITITATDYKGKPVKDMSILTYAYTSKFNQDPNQTLPDLSSKQKSKYVVNNFTEQSNFNKRDAVNLNYPFWKRHLALDTIPGFRFIFPEAGIERIDIPAKNGITQIAPFVTDSGRLQGVHYVLVNHVPMYFGFTQHKMPYSFPIGNNDYNEIRIRTKNSLIIIDSFKATPHCKAMFTVDLHRYMKHVTIKPMPDTLTKDEVNNYSSYIIKINENNAAEEDCYLTSPYYWGAKRLQNNVYNRYYSDRYITNTFGPITNAGWVFHVPGNYSIDFEVSPGFTYTFRSQHVKMVGAAQLESMINPKTTCNIPSLDEWVITAAEIEEQHRQVPVKRRRSINYALDYNGNADLQIEFSQLAKDTLGRNIEPLNIILTQPDNFDFFNIYPGSTRYFHRLPAGKYNMLIMEENGIYRTVDNIELKSDGINFFRIGATDTLSKKKVAKLDSFINALYYLPDIDMKKAAPVLMGKLIETTYDGPVERFRGTVVDEKGEGIPGASIMIKNANAGTITDVDGNFEIAVPIPLLRGLTFVMNGITYEKAEFPAEQNKKYILKENMHSELNEVTVMGTRIDPKSYVGSVSTVTAADVEKSPVTNVLSALSGSAPGVQVSSGGGQPGSSPDIVMRGFGSLSAGQTPVIVLNGVIYSGTLSSIDPSLVGSISLLKEAEATSLYGARGANGAIIITTKQGAILPDNIKKALEEATPIIPDDIMVGGLRSHFRDDAFWQPNLITDKDGKVSFKVKFPDDLTSWNTYVYATDDKLRVGQTSGNIKSFKPVSAALLGTTFLVEGDSANFIGKSVNYISDTIAITNSYFINDSLQKETPVTLTKYNNEIIPIVAARADSVKLKYLLTKADGYFDGEEKTVEIVPRGVSVAKGAFLTLDENDTTITIPPVNNKEPLYLSATASLLDIVVDEIDKVNNYKHLCNEQLSSKIIATLTQQKIYEALKKPLPKNHKATVQKMITLLQQRQNSSKLWGWWADGQTVYWISQHVMKALNMARSMNYNAGNFNFENVVQPLVYNWENDTNYADVQSLKLLYTAGMKIDYEKYLKRAERRAGTTLGQKLELIKLRQELKLPYNTKILTDLKQEDIYGNIFWKDTMQYIYENEIITTLTAFKILQADSSIHINKHKIINWFIRERKIDGWRNIYEGSQIIEAIASSIDLSDTNALKPKLQFSGGLNKLVDTFPFVRKINTNEAITLQKSGNTPVYFSWYQRQWDTADNNLGKDFVVKSDFVKGIKEVKSLKGGENVQLKVTVKVLKSADFVMIDIPVPAGCSYENKSRGYNGNEVHREYYKDRVSIFCEKLPKGEYTYYIELMPRYTGTYTLNPAKAELMYFPVFYGREKLKKIEIN